MKKYLLIFFCLMVACAAAFAQGRDKKLKTKKLSKEEAASMTQEQRLAHENARITKDGKKKMSAKQKAKVQRKQARAARSTKAPKNGPRPKPKD